MTASNTNFSRDFSGVLWRAFGRFEKVCHVLSIAGIGIAASSILFVAFLGSIDVVTTALFGGSLPITVELGSYLLAIIIFGALAVAQRRQEHIAVDLIVKRLPVGLQFILRVTSLMVSVCLFVLLTWRSWILAFDSIEIRQTASAAYAFPVWPFKIGVSVMLVIVTLEFIRQLVRAVCGHEWIVTSNTRSVVD